VPNVTSSDRLATRILWGLGVGLGAGALTVWLEEFLPGLAKGARWLADAALNPIGQIFLGLLFFVVVPIVFASLALGVVQLGRLDKLGPLAGRTLALFALNMAVGVAIGLVIMNAVRPGTRLPPEQKQRLLAEFGSDAREAQTKADTAPHFSFALLVQMFLPKNLLKSIVEFQLLPLILFSLLLGAAGTQLPEAQRRKLQEALEILSALMTRLVHYALLLAPYAVAAMIFAVVVKVGAGFLKPLLLFVACALGGMALHLFGTMSLLLKLLSRRSPREFFRAIRTILVTAFSTSSSNATLPTSLQVSRENLGISASTAGFVLPLGATMNMSGTALYEGCVVLFIAQVYGIELGLAQQVTLLALAVLSAVAVAGIPGGSLPLIVGLLANLQIPPEGIALILGTDRLLDMARTVLNVGADAVTACIVDETLTQ
jgi:DAACS family dicarboxylate/amino acid:cation (Na+ or H+) symporter